MTNRELLELAAKAAGYRVHGWINDKLYVINGPNPAEYYDPFSWNPLSDDGDALRLAVALRIDLHFEEQPSWCGEIVEAFSPMREDGSRHCEMRELKPDPNAATRRAIVRAAAEIGKRGEQK
ncbi:TPA: hypothetical protein QDA91_005600 [Burkholderia vietnamiensis]|nr:hypothetical protein [Burkholderia vietnamiensis]